MRRVRGALDHQEIGNAVAIISVLSTAAVAIAVPFINARLERRRLGWQSEQAQFEELRRLLDDAMLRIREASVALWAILDVPFPRGAPQTNDRFATIERSRFSDDQLSDLGALVSRYERALQLISQDQIRLDLRLAQENSVRAAHDAVMRQLMAFRPRVSRFSDLVAGTPTVTVSWTQQQLDILGGLRDTFAGEVRALFGSTFDRAAS